MKFTTLHNPKDIRQLINYHNTVTGYCVMDFETTGLDTHTCDLLDIQMAGYEEDSAVIFDGKFLPLLSEIKVTHVFHNFKYDWAVAFYNGVDFRELDVKVFDTMLLHHLHDENKAHGLDDIVQELWQDNYKEVFWAKYKSYAEAPPDERMEYACKDIVYTERLFKRMEIELTVDNIPDELVDHVHSLALSLYNTELEGVCVDLPYIHQLQEKYSKTLTECQNSMRALVKTDIAIIEVEMHKKEMSKRKTMKGKASAPEPVFSFDSTKQLQTLLYIRLGLPPQVNEKTKQPSTDEKALEKLKDMHPLIPMLIQYRQNFKILSTYIQGTLERVKDGVIYPSFNVNGTVTGRISHSDPNLGNLPREGGIRAMFIPSPGNVFISADYASLEIFIGAHFTQDPSLLKIVREGASQHDITAKGLGIDRQTAKNVNFAMMYGASHFKIAKMLGVHPAKGKEAWDAYWRTYPGVKRVMDQCAQKVDNGIPIQSPFGRCRRFEVKDREPWDSAYRQAFNALVQGTGADCTNKAFYLIDSILRSEGMGRALFSVHDELLIEVKKELAKEAEDALLYTMMEVGKDIHLTTNLKAVGSGPMKAWLD